MTKPDWKDAPYWAKYLAMDDNLRWNWFSDLPEYNRATGVWGVEDWALEQEATVPYDASQTLEGRPEEEEGCDRPG